MKSLAVVDLKGTDLADFRLMVEKQDLINPTTVIKIDLSSMFDNPIFRFCEDFAVKNLVDLDVGVEDLLPIRTFGTRSTYESSFYDNCSDQVALAKRKQVEAIGEACRSVKYKSDLDRVFTSLADTLGNAMYGGLYQNPHSDPFSIQDKQERDIYFPQMLAIRAAESPKFVHQDVNYWSAGSNADSVYTFLYYYDREGDEDLPFCTSFYDVDAGHLGALEREILAKSKKGTLVIFNSLLRHAAHFDPAEYGKERKILTWHVVYSRVPSYEDPDVTVISPSFTVF